MRPNGTTAREYEALCCDAKHGHEYRHKGTSAAAVTTQALKTGAYVFVDCYCSTSCCGGYVLLAYFVHVRGLSRFVLWYVVVPASACQCVRKAVKGGI